MTSITEKSVCSAIAAKSSRTEETRIVSLPYPPRPALPPSRLDIAVAGPYPSAAWSPPASSLHSLCHRCVSSFISDVADASLRTGTFPTDVLADDPAVAIVVEACSSPARRGDSVMLIRYNQPPNAPMRHTTKTASIVFTAITFLQGYRMLLETAPSVQYRKLQYPQISIEAAFLAVISPIARWIFCFPSLFWRPSRLRPGARKPAGSNSVRQL